MSDTAALPTVNPALTDAFTKIVTAVRSAGARSIGAVGEFPLLGAVFAVILAIGVLVWRFVYAPPLESPETIRSLAKAATLAQAHYSVGAQQRKGLADILAHLKQKGVPDAELILGNFHISTVHSTGLFTPARDGIVTPEAARAAVLAGARGFVFDIWPDLTPGAGFAPILQAVEPGSLWRRISLNALPFATVLRDLIQEALELPERPGHDDPVLLYLRFNGTPRTETFTGVASALRTLIEPYRLDAPYYNCRAAQSLFALPMASLFRKVIVFSNVRAQGTALADYINAAPMEGLPLEMTVNEVKTLSAEGRADAIRKIQRFITFVAPTAGTPDAEDNYAFTTAHALGIQCAAINFWKDGLYRKQYMDTSAMNLRGGPITIYGWGFETESFRIKVPNLRYRVQTLPAPGVPTNPGMGDGSLRAPAALQSP